MSYMSFVEVCGPFVCTCVHLCVCVRAYMLSIPNLLKLAACGRGQGKGQVCNVYCQSYEADSAALLPIIVLCCVWLLIRSSRYPLSPCTPMAAPWQPQAAPGRWACRHTVANTMIVWLSGLRLIICLNLTDRLTLGYSNVYLNVKKYLKIKAFLKCCT